MFGLSSFKKNLLPRLTALALCLSILAPMVPAAVTTASAEGDVPYYQAPMEKLTSWDVLSGYPDGELHPERPVTRAEFVAMVNRAYGYDDPGPTPFTDVPESAWYADDIGIAYNMGYFSGTTPTTASPDTELTREQAMVLLAHNMRLESEPGEVTQFTDGRDFSSYSKGYVKAAVKRGLISGFPDGSFQPRSSITRGQMATILSNALGTLVTGGGTQALGSVYGNLTINEAGATLQDTVITGDLYISGGLDLGAVTLENVRVLGDIIVSGGGEVESGQDSVILRNVEADNLLVDSLGGQYLSLRAEGDTLIDKTSVRSSAYLQDRTPSGLGLLNISLEGRDGLPANFSLSGNLETVVNRTPGSDLVVSRGTVKSLTVDEKANGSALTVDVNTTVKNLNLDTAVPVQGVGDVETLNVSTAGSSTTMFPDNIVVRPGVNVMVSGTSMDAALAEESTQAPRLLAGFPSARNIAPTSATAYFSTNKSGTVYWAVSAISDGSVGESELLSPSSYGSPALKSGNLNAAAANTELSTAVTGLTKGGTYYLSAMLVDTRGAHSPVKTISFETPDDSVPDFANGSPAMSKLSSTYAQATATTTKNCDLYWALYAQGSTAPTADDFKAGALDGSLDSGIVSGVVKNYPEFIDVGHRDLETDSGTLEELATYDLYMWLNDADNSKSSAVKKLTFSTVDKTPPRFTTDPLTPGTLTATSVPLTGSLDEAGKIFWAVVEHDTDYPAPIPGSSEKTAPLDSQHAKSQVQSGNGSLKHGSVSTTGGTDDIFPFSVNVTGLAGETTYDLYYVALDNANNYSETVKKMTIHTQDSNAPTVRQEFTDSDSLNPPASTGVDIVFSEDIQQTSANSFESLMNLYLAVRAAGNNTEARKDAKDAMAKALRAMIELRDITASPKGVKAADRAENETAGKPDDPWVIDYREAVMSYNEEGGLVVSFPHGTALNLGSARRYQFTVQDFSDMADPRNVVKGTVPLDPFRTISAQVGVESLRMRDKEQIMVLTGSAVPDKDPSEADTPLLLSRDADGKITVPCAPATIKGGFYLDPESTESVPENTGWDLLLWTDKDIKLNLYYTVIRMDPNDPEKYLDPREDWAWVKLNDSPVDFSPSRVGSEYSGKSLTLNFGFTPQHGFEDLRELHETSGSCPLRYGFAYEITQIGASEPTAWTGVVNFRVNVVSGDTEFLSPLSQGAADRANYDRYVLADNAKLSDITETADFSLNDPVGFAQIASFSDTSAPYFSPGYPEFTPNATSVEISHQFSQPEVTVRYVVFDLTTSSNLLFTTKTTTDNPYNEIYNKIYNPHTKKDEDGNEVIDDEGNPVADSEANKTTPVTVSGSNYAHKAKAEDGSLTTTPVEPPILNSSSNYKQELADYTWLPTGWDENVTRPNYIQFPLEAPSIDTITRYSTSGRAGVIKGSFSGDENPGTTTISGLTKNHDYLMYLYINSKGDNPSAPQLFFFRTTEAVKPVVSLDKGASPSQVAITDTTKKETVNSQWILVRDNPSHVIDALQKKLPAWTDPSTNTSYKAEEMTVQEALTTRHYKGTNRVYDGSLFDIFVTTEPEKAEEFVDALNILFSSGQGTGGEGDVVLGNSSLLDAAHDYSDLVDCKDYEGNGTNKGDNYIFICRSVNTSSGTVTTDTPTSYVGYQYLTIQDDKLIKVDNIDVYIQKAEKGGVYGTITLSFTDYIYNHQEKVGATPPTKPHPIEHTEVGYGQTDDNGDIIESTRKTVGLGELNITGGGTNIITPIYEGDATGRSTQEFQFRFHAEGSETGLLTSGGSISISGYVDPAAFEFGRLANSNNTPNPKPLRLYLDLTHDEAHATWTATAYVNGDWDSGETKAAHSRSYDVPVERIIIPSPAINLKPGEAAQIQVTFIPDNATNKNLIWSGGNNYVTVDQNGIVTVSPDATPGGVGVPITVESADNGSKATATVHILQP